MRCTKYVNKRMVESLILGGAFDSFGYRRSQYTAVYEDLMHRIAGMDKQKSGAQLSLFGTLIAEETPKAEYPDIPRMAFRRPAFQGKVRPRRVCQRASLRAVRALFPRRQLQLRAACRL